MNESEPARALVTGRRDRQRERRRSALYDIAMGLFIEKGFEGTTMDDVADRADVARATVFNYYPRKAAFLQEWATRRRGRATKAADLIEAGGSLRHVLMRYFQEMGAISDRSRGETVAVVSAAMHMSNVWQLSPIALDFAVFIDRAKKTGEVTSDLDAKRVGALFGGAYFTILTAWISSEPAPFNITDELIATTDLLLTGILPRP